MVRPLWQLLLEDLSKLICDQCSAVLEYCSELLAWGDARYRFRPPYSLCPIAVPLALSIRGAVVEVEGINRQEILEAMAAEMKVLVTPIGGYGFIPGRGSKQFTRK